MQPPAAAEPVRLPAPVPSIPFGMPPRRRPDSVPESPVVEPAIPEPAIPEPATTEPATTDPAATEPVVAEPPVAEAAVTGPVAAEGPEEAVPPSDPAGRRPAEPVPASPESGSEPDEVHPRMSEDDAGQRWSTISASSRGVSSELDASEPRPSNLDLTSGALVRRSRRTPVTGWRRGVHRLTGGILAPGESADEAHRRELVDRVRQPISGDYRIAVLSLKGGVGKTTTTVGLGATFASLRGDCVIAVDANPDFGTLAQRVPQQTESTVRDLLAAAPRISRYSDVRAHTSQAPSRLEVLASERDPAVSEAFSEDDYRRVVDILRVYYNVVLTDCGTGIMHSAMRGVLALAHALVLVASPAIDGARSAAATLDWLQHHGFGALVERTVVVISAARPGATNIDMEAVTGHFLARCRAVQVVPFDEHLAEGAEIDLGLLRPATRRAFLELAAMVADDFATVSGRHAAGRRA
ncbi:AAA family ATPase [Rhodococcus sp. 11-3]|nr:AAA family ATPase [Rhodococcus sp. 11-3]